MDDEGFNKPRPPGEMLRYGEIQPRSGADMLQAGVDAGNIVRQTGAAEVLELPQVRGRDLV